MVFGERIYISLTNKHHLSAKILNGESQIIEKKSAKRKTFVTREDLINQLSKIAKARGHSLYETVNDLFELALTSEALGLTLKRVVEERCMVEEAKKKGFALGLEQLWYEMADIAYEEKKTAILESWFEAGVWFAKCYITDNSSSSFENFKNALLLFTWNTPEFRIWKTRTGISIRVMSPRFSDSYTCLFASFIKGGLETFGYTIVSSEVKQGTIRLEGIKEVNSLWLKPKT